MKKKNRNDAKSVQAKKIAQATNVTNKQVSFYCPHCRSKFNCSKSQHEKSVHDNIPQPIKRKGGKKGVEKREKKKEEEEGKKKKKKEEGKKFRCNICNKATQAAPCFDTRKGLEAHICGKHAKTAK